jgi:N-acylneuraminate cytidylyltransferase/CMP-N,N'-diacetyllegionaminic acid synthase
LKKILFIILARGGSKGLPGKNKMQLLGKPVIAYSIETALSSKYCNQVIVSTDDFEIAEIAKQYGAQVPFIRPAEFASDTATSSDAILHAISFFEKDGKEHDMIVLLEPTSPLRDPEDLNAAIEMLLNNKEAKSCVSVTKLESGHPRFLFNLDNELRLSSYLNQNNVVRRQDLESLFYPEGSFYLAYTDDYKQKKTFYQDQATLGFEIPKWKSFEIDTYEDFIIIEALMKAKRENKFNSI